MLVWKEENGDWLGNGYRIEQLSPKEWVLKPNSDTTVESQVAVEVHPLATLPTLTACRYEAETLHLAERIRTQRTRLTGILLGAIVGSLLVGVGSFPGVLLVGSAVAAGTKLMLTWLDPLMGSAREVLQ